MRFYTIKSISYDLKERQTKEEALANIEEAIQLCLEVRAERGMPFSNRDLSFRALRQLNPCF